MMIPGEMEHSQHLPNKLLYKEYDPQNLAEIISLIENDLSEPYSIFTYHYFLENYSHLCHTAWAISKEDDSQHQLVGVVIGRCVLRLASQNQTTSEQRNRARGTQDTDELPPSSTGRLRGYIGMLAVRSDYRKRGIGLELARLVIQRMIDMDRVDEIVLEAEVSNLGALKLYSRLGFVRDKRLPNYYLNGSDAFRLKLWTTPLI